MRNNLFINALSYSTFIIFLLVNSCGGGGSSTGTGNTYTGLTSQAVVTEDNAQPIIENAFMGSSFGSVASSGFSAITVNKTGKGEPLTRYLSMPAKNIARIVIDHPCSKILVPMSAIQSVPINEAGACGGTLSGSMQVNDQTGSFTGSFRFNNFCEEGEVSNGTIAFSGTINSNDNMNISMTLNSFSMINADEDFNALMSGTMTMAINGSSSTITMNINIKDNVAGDEYMMENIVSQSTINNQGDTIEEISGRFYSTDYGYVDLATEDPCITTDNNDNPSSGIIIATGAGNTKSKLTCLSSTTYKVEADTNGDGTYEWDSGTLSW